VVTVAIDARIVDGIPGGVQQAVLGLASGLASLDERGDSYLFLVYREHSWLQPALTGPCRALVVREEPSRQTGPFRKAARYLVQSRGRVLPSSDGTAEAAGAQLIHFMQQRGFRTSLPNIYQPHDLQHLHHPEWFHPLQRAYRRLSYRAMARQASRVAVMTTAARAETAVLLGVPEARIIVVPWASLMSLYPDDPRSKANLRQLGLPARYLLYPAQSWPHKNHLGLVRALALLRAEYGLAVPVVLTGRTTAHWSTVADEAQRIGVDDLIHPLGFVDVGALRQLYQEAEALVFPSLYEGWGLPVVEALEVGLPVLCSEISPLREIAAGAAAHFDPHDPAAIAETVRSVWTDPAERRRLGGAGRRRSRAFSWPRTAALFRAHYRDVLGLEPLGDEAALLKRPPPA
jgi:glycosyltransferase involved in cell wall biosynthesis